METTLTTSTSAAFRARPRESTVTGLVGYGPGAEPETWLTQDADIHVLEPGQDELCLLGSHDLEFCPEALSRELENVTATTLAFPILLENVFADQDPTSYVARMGAAFPDASQVVVVAAPDTAAEVLYRNYVRLGGSLHIRELFYRPGSPGVDVFAYPFLVEAITRNPEPTRETCVIRVDHQKGRLAAVEALGLPTSALLTTHRPRYALSYGATHRCRWINQVTATPHSDAPSTGPIQARSTAGPSQSA